MERSWDTQGFPHGASQLLPEISDRLVDGGNRQTFFPKRHKPQLGSCNRLIHIIYLTLSYTTKEYHPSHGHSIMANWSTTLDQGLHSVHVSGTLPMKTVRFCAKTLAPWCHRKICGAWIRRIPHTIHTSHNYLDPWYQNSINSTSQIWIDRWPSWLGMVRHGSTRSLEASLSLSSASSSFRFLDLGAMDGPSPEMSRAKVGLESSRATSVLNEEWYNYEYRQYRWNKKWWKSEKKGIYIYDINR